MPPQDREFYRQVDGQFEGLLLKLQRARQQINALTDDTGVYKSRAWTNLGGTSSWMA